MSELLAKVEGMAQFVELYDDEIHMQMPLAIMQVIKLKDIIDIEFKKANFFMAGKMTIKYREKGVNGSAYFPFNFVLNDGMMAVVSMMNERIDQLKGIKETPPEVVVKEVIKVRCRYCGGLMDEHADVCPVCGRPAA
jgi:hypothetical protein